MKKINLNLAVIALIFAALIISITSCNRNTESKAVGEVVKVGDSVKYSKLPIAYVNVDSLLINYKFAKELNEALLRKQESSRASLNAKAKVLQAEMADFQKKVENNAFLSRERAESEQKRLLGKQQELQQMEQRLSSDLMVQQQKMNEQLRDKVSAFLKEYNKEKGYEMIISNTMFDNVLYAKPSYNITNDVIKQLNEEYESKK